MQEFQSYKAKMFVRDHEYYCKNKFKCNCKRVEIDFVYPNVIETKADDMCYIHNQQFDNECHLLPSGKKMWMGCPMCQTKNTAKRHNEEVTQLMRQSGMRMNKETKMWEKTVMVNPTPEK